MSIRPRSIFVFALTLGGLIAARGADAQTAFSVSANIGDFHVAVSNYYHVPEREVIVVRERRIPDEELLSRINAAVRPARVRDVLFKEMLIQ